MTTSPQRPLPPSANVEFLRKQAKDLHKSQQRDRASMKLTDAQHELARSYGFASWPKLMAHVKNLATERPAASIYTLIADGNADAVGTVLDANPDLVHAHSSEGPRGAGDRAYQLTPLQFAARHGKLAICRLLVERGAEVYTHPHATYPPVIEAAWAGHQDVVDYFLHEIPDQASGTNGLGVAINLAAREGWADVVRQHIERDPLSVHQRGWIGDTPLHWPSHNNKVDIVAMLLDAGADIEAEENNWIGGKPLHWAAEHAPDCVRLLLERGAQVDSRNTRPGSKFEGVTPLIMNATQPEDMAEIAEMLIAAGADVQAVDAQGRTALDHAMQRGLERIPPVLRAHGATA